MTTTITAFLVLAGALGYVGYDVIVATNDIQGDTISAVLRRWGRDMPVVVYIWGVLGGHFWAGSEALSMSAGDELRITLWSMWMGLILSLWWYHTGRTLTWWGALLVVNIGLLVGHFLWSQA